MSDARPVDLPGVGDDIAMREGGWDFARAVDHFEEHIRRSIPLCEEGREYVARLSTYFTHQDSYVYELGVSTGALAKLVLERNAGRNITYVGIDVVPEMVQRAAKSLVYDKRFVAEVADAGEYEFREASLILAYYTVQFVPPRKRQVLINAIYKALEWGGAFIMYEKVRGSDARFQDILMQLYTDFKLEKGFSADEIINKSRALKGILEPFSTAGNLDLLRRAGFGDVMIIHKFYCFEGYLAIK